MHSRLLVRLAVVAVIWSEPSLVKGWESARINARLGGFGFAGVAIVPSEHSTSLRLNPATAALLIGDRQLNAGVVSERDANWVATVVEAYLPVRGLTLLGSGYYYEDFDWYYGEPDWNLTDLSISLGVARSLGSGIVNLGGEATMWTSKLTSGRDENLIFDLGPEWYVRAGLHLRVGTALKVGVTYNTESKDTDSGAFAFIPPSLRLGAAFQRDDRPWLAGVEFASYQKVEFEHARSLGRLEYHVYTEYQFTDKLAVRGGASREKTGDWRPRITLSLGVSYWFKQWFGLDAFILNEDLEFRVDTPMGFGVGTTFRL